MKFYLRKPGSADVLGPHTREEILAQIAAGTLATDCEAVEATGQSFGTLKRSTDWVPLSSVCSPENIATARASSVASQTQPFGSLQMKPRTFGQVFGQAVPFAGGGFFGLLYLLNVDHVRYSDKQTEQLLVGSLFFGIVMGLVAAYFYRGEIIDKECEDAKKVLQTLAVRLAENRYNLETQTEALHTFKPPFDRWLGGRIYILSEGRMLRIVGPAYVLKKLRNV